MPYNNVRWPLSDALSAVLVSELDNETARFGKARFRDDKEAKCYAAKGF
jgi:hypothetical protein